LRSTRLFSGNQFPVRALPSAHRPDLAATFRFFGLSAINADLESICLRRTVCSYGLWHNGVDSPSTERISPVMSDPRALISDCRGRLTTLIARCRLWRDQSGGAAVDFALIAAPFLAVLMAIIESSIVLLAGQVLQTSTTNAARQIMTGQAQNAAWSAAQFKTYVCGGLTVMFDCTKLNIDVRAFSSFSTVNLPSVTNPNGTLTNSYVYQPGNPGDVIVVRLIYQWPIIASALGIGLVTSAGNTNTLVATAAFRNEPY